MSLTSMLDVRQEQKRDELATRLFQASLGMLDIWSVYLGHHLGYYDFLASGKSATSGDLARATDTHERYAREWLEQQAATGIIEVNDAETEPLFRRYSLPAGHAEALTATDSLQFAVPLVRYIQATSLIIPRLLEAYRSGGGIPWTEMGEEIRDAQEYFNRALYLSFLGTENIPAVADVHKRLRADPPARVADICCGAGWSSIAIAKAYPGVRVDGFDVDPVTVEKARKNAAEQGVADRVAFDVRDAADRRQRGSYDLVMFLECLHDIGRPIETLRAAHSMLAPGGSVIVMDERVAERFAAPADEIDRFFYGWSIVQCLPGGMADQPSAGTGTVMRPATLERYAKEAGFSSATTLPIDTDPMRRWYWLRP